jgi:O-antigen ligase/polysaccharide polymerase Wzy-like membrane protein
MRALDLDLAWLGRANGPRAGWAVRRSGLSERPLVNLALTLALVAALSMIGWSLAEGQLQVPILAAAGLAVCWLALAERGAFIGILLLAAMNGIPAFDTSSYLVSHFTGQDLAICLLLLTGATWALMGATPARPTRASRVLIASGALLLGWCLFTLGRTIVAEHVPVMTAVAFARDYLYFAALLIVLPLVRLTRRDITALALTLAAGVCFFATVQTAVALGLGRPGSLIHVSHTLEQDGLRRVYSDMTDLVTAGLAISLAASLLARDRTLRAVARPLAALLTVSVVVQLTRARWVGLIVALVLVTAWLALQRDGEGDSALLRRRVLAVIAVLCLIVVFVAALDPTVLSGGPFAGRLTSVFSDLEGKTGTVAVRQTISKAMTHYLGAQWLGGLGFLSPAAHYFAGVPHGSIEDPDLGVLNAVMPMGVIGAALIYLPVALIAIQCLRVSAGPSRYSWLRYGVAIWAVATLVSSVTLVTLFSTSGLALAAVLLSVAACAGVFGQSEEPAAALEDVRGARPRPALGSASSALAR